MADIDLDFLARQMERLLTEMQGMREEMGRAGSKTKCNTDTFIVEVLQCPRVTST